MMPSAVDPCITNGHDRAHSEQAREIAVTLFTDAAEPLLATTRVETLDGTTKL
jgi:hypothetical protein